MIGFVPSNYIKQVAGVENEKAPRKSLSKKKSSLKQQNDRPFKHLIIPAIVKVVANRRPSLYDSKAMTLKKGQLIHLTKLYSSGMCFGTNQETGISGIFPFTFVKWTNQPIINNSPPEIKETSTK
uniref:SH3 domain-containing protein n=1 Tax=Panagrolaimus superbus TaxID=310955 RepID=A0A914ZB00_9BILA